ncbi:hypothetical protein glysoja_039891 [Glycine soja]|uniref:Uncharacterized protein n=1 Tax=Glycine soja TaxID=3848 RepID=A0A0B2QGR1_GLYSO|nr:hypothetical protein glysoja_039891 [Glycine soja]
MLHRIKESQEVEFEVGLLNNATCYREYLPLSEEMTKMVKHVIHIEVLEAPSLSKHTIYKAPKNLRKVKEDAYTPQCISIGPIHLGKQELEKMQEYKKLPVEIDHFQARARCEPNRILSRGYDLDTSMAQQKHHQGLDPSRGSNTLLWFVDLAIEYFAFYNTQMFYSIKYKKQFFSGSHRSSSKSTKHFTDLIRFDYLPVGIAVKSGYARHVLRTATKLRDSGVSFEKGDVRRSLLDI